MLIFYSATNQMLVYLLMARKLANKLALAHKVHQL